MCCQHFPEFYKYLQGVKSPFDLSLIRKPATKTQMSEFSKTKTWNPDDEGYFFINLAHHFSGSFIILSSIFPISLYFWNEHLWSWSEIYPQVSEVSNQCKVSTCSPSAFSFLTDLSWYQMRPRHSNWLNMLTEGRPLDIRPIRFQPLVTPSLFVQFLVPCWVTHCS